MLVKDEADIIEATVRHLLEQVDEVLVADNLSTDGTWEKLAAIASDQFENVLLLERDSDPAYYQAVKTTRLAEFARRRGHDWVVPCDADEWWYAPGGRTIASWLGGMGREVQFVEAALFNHLPTALDPPATCSACGTQGLLHVGAGGGLVDLGPSAGGLRDPCPLCHGRVEPNPVARIGWRQREAAPLPKVACRLRPGLEIRQGNHSAWAPGAGLTASGLVIRHFSWRSPEQFVRKVRNGAAAYAATDLPADVGAHWRDYGRTLEEHGEQALVDHYLAWFYSPDPRADSTLIYDPAPQKPARALADVLDAAKVDVPQLGGLIQHKTRREMGVDAPDLGEPLGWMER